MATELASSKLPSQEADEFRSDVNRLLKEQQQQHHNNCNLNPAQPSAEPLHNSSKTTPGWFLQWTRGWPWLSWTNKITTPKHKPFYKTPTPIKSTPRTLPPHSKINLSTFSRTSKQSGGFSTQKYKKLYPTSAAPQILWPSKIHKTGTPLRPIVSSRGSITYGVAKELSHIIKPLVGQSPHHLKNTQHFIQQLKGKRLQAGESITSFDVKALFTSMPVQPSIQIVHNRLQQDTTLPQRTTMSIPQIISLLEFCLTHTYFSSRVSIMNRYKVQLWDPPSATS